MSPSPFNSGPFTLWVQRSRSYRLDYLLPKEKPGDELERVCTKALIERTAHIRVYPPKSQFSCNGGQRCHIVGLNLLKEIFNDYGYRCRRITLNELAETVVAAAEVNNFTCCTKAANSADRETEDILLDSFFDPNIALEDEDARKMLEDLIGLLEDVQDRLRKGYGVSISFNYILKDLRQM